MSSPQWQGTDSIIRRFSPTARGQDWPQNQQRDFGYVCLLRGLCGGKKKPKGCSIHPKIPIRPKKNTLRASNRRLFCCCKKRRDNRSKQQDGLRLWSGLILATQILLLPNKRCLPNHETRKKTFQRPDCWHQCLLKTKSPEKLTHSLQTAILVF